MNIIPELLAAVTKTKNTIQKKHYILALPIIVRNLGAEIRSNAYSPSRFSCFAVRDPKPREIFAPHFRDRIVHHLLIDKIEPILDKRFIHDTYANRKGKGIHTAISRLQRFLNNSNNRYFLQIDIKNFFPSINKPILFSVFCKHMETMDLTEVEKTLSLYLAEKIIFNNPAHPSPVFTGNRKQLKQIPAHKSLFHADKDKGLPIGSLSSQFFANLYLNELDQFVKKTLKIKYYIRYVDDIVILAENTCLLSKYKEEIDGFLQSKLMLALHPNKTIMQSTKHGINFLGYVVRKDYTLVRIRTVKSLKRRLYFFNHLLDPLKYPISNAPQMMNLAKKYHNEKWIPPIKPTYNLMTEFLAVINSYYGILSFADTFQLRMHLYEKHFGKLKLFFEPKDIFYKAMTIRKGAYLR